ncbi:MAG TPA: cation-translocating P-type ATPase [Candidatus Saccharibacteria bacterium]|nr:cation-translocating P-type ATPase [Candidatus Saccharibacteria bacterium]
MNSNKKQWYKLTSDQVIKSLKSDIFGLSKQEAKSRLKQDGPNILPEGARISPFTIFKNQFKDVLIGVLIAAATVSMVLSLIQEKRASTEAFLIYIIVVAIAIVGFLNEYRAEKTLASLRNLLSFTAKVRRSGKIIEIDSSELVVGDIILIEEGQKIPADIRLIKGEQLSINESSLTGESTVSDKSTEIIPHNSALGDQKNMIFSGTYVASGTGEGVVIAIGSDTQIGKIATMVEGIEAELTPMQRKLNDLGKKLGIVVSLLCVVVFFVVLVFDKELTGGTASKLVFAFTAAVALAVAAIPEGLAFVVRISLALGARRMAKKNALVRKLSAVEALGSTDIICSDKTGTLTKGEMTVTNLWVDAKKYNITGEGYSIEGELLSSEGKKIPSTDSINLLMTLGVLANNSNLKEGVIIGDPTEGCLLVSAHKISLDYNDLQTQMPRLKEFPFNSERKMMSTIHQDGNEKLVAVKGAPDQVLARCSSILIDGKIIPLNDTRRKAVLAQNADYGKSALRVLAFATKNIKTIPATNKAVENDLVFVGLQAMIDPPRAEVAEVIKRVQHDAGMRVIMITGDHIETAKAIAAQLGIEGDAISGVELDELSQEEFEAHVEQTSIYARVNPEHKIRIVQALKKLGHQVAMTGDGVNDAPAIKAANIGIAMGITGTDVTKQAADLILLDDQFLTIIAAIEEGRGIYDNIRKFVNFLLSANIAEVLTILAGIIFFKKLLLSPSQILFINIVTDGLPAIALGSDPAAKNIMKNLPAKYQRAIINFRTWVEIFVFGILMTGALLLLYNNASPYTSAAVVFTGMVIFEMVRLVDIRTDYEIKWLSNPLLTISIFISIALQIAVLHIPALAKLFEVNPLALNQWFYIAGLSITLYACMKLLNKPFKRFGKEN